MGRDGPVPGHPQEGQGGRRDIIGLSGLITPSLEEMHTSPPRWRPYFAERGKTPLLIGGATGRACTPR